MEVYYHQVESLQAEARLLEERVEALRQQLMNTNHVLSLLLIGKKVRFTRLDTHAFAVSHLAGEVTQVKDDGSLIVRVDRQGSYDVYIQQITEILS